MNCLRIDGHITHMEFKTFKEEELNTFSKEMIVTLYLQLASSFQLLSQQNEQILSQNQVITQQNEKQLRQIENLQESIAILTNHRFGRRTEKTSEILDGQIFLNFDDLDESPR